MTTGTGTKTNAAPKSATPKKAAPKTDTKKTDTKKTDTKKAPESIGGILPGEPSGFANPIKVNGAPLPSPKPQARPSRQLDRGGIFRIVANTLGQELMRSGDKEAALDAALAKAQELTTTLIGQQAEEENGQFAETSKFLIEWGQKFGVEPQLVRVEAGEESPIRFEPFGRSIERFIENWDAKSAPTLGMELMSAVTKVRLLDRDGNERPALWGKVITDLNQKVMNRMAECLKS